MKKQRDGEADNPGPPPHDDGQTTDADIFNIISSNVHSLMPRVQAVADWPAKVLVLQETKLT